MEKNYEDLTLKELFEVYNKFSKISDEYSEKVKSADKIKSELKNIIWERVGKQKTKMNDFTIYQMKPFLKLYCFQFCEYISLT